MGEDFTESNKAFVLSELQRTLANVIDDEALMGFEVVLEEKYINVEVYTTSRIGTRAKYKIYLIVEEDL